jgi:hypothetical protein
MALQVRRGTNAERLGITPLAGELVYTTDTKQLYVGDGATAGGITSIAGTIDSLLADTTPQLGGTLDLNGNDITGAGNININGTITATGNINLGDGAGSDVISVGGSLAGHLLPSEDTTWNLGALTYQFKEAWISQLNVENQITAGRINANLIADDSTVVFDATTGLIAAAQLTGTATINVTGNLTGSVDGDLTGDILGSVFGDDSTLLVDGVNSEIVGRVRTLSTLTVNGVVGQIADGENILIAEGFIDPSSGRNSGVGMNIRGARNDGSGNPVVVQAGDALLDIVASGWDGNSYKPAMAIKFAVAKNVTVSDEIVPGRIIFAAYDDTGNFGLNSIMVFTHQGRLSIGSGDAPAAKLDVSGEVLLGRLTTTQRDALTAVNGMILYNSTDNKFQGYENGAWVNLI